MMMLAVGNALHLPLFPANASSLALVAKGTFFLLIRVWHVSFFVVVTPLHDREPTICSTHTCKAQDRAVPGRERRRQLLSGSSDILCLCHLWIDTEDGPVSDLNMKGTWPHNQVYRIHYSAFPKLRVGARTRCADVPKGAAAQS